MRSTSKSVRPYEEKKVEVLSASLEALADNVAVVSQMGKAIQSSSLSQRAIVLLLQDITKLPQTNIIYVLNALPELEKTYLKNKKTRSES